MNTMTSPSTATTGRVTPFVAPSLPAPSAGRVPAEWPSRPRAAGWAEGYEDGRRCAEAELAALTEQQRRANDRLVSALVALESAAKDLARRDAIAILEIEDDVVGMAVALATEIVGRELTLTERPVIDAMVRASKLVPDRGVPVVRVSAADVEVARSVIEDDTTPWSAAVDIVADPTVAPGDCVVDVGSCRIDAGIDAALGRIRAALG